MAIQNYRPLAFGLVMLGLATVFTFHGTWVAVLLCVSLAIVYGRHAWRPPSRSPSGRRDAE